MLIAKKRTIKVDELIKVNCNWVLNSMGTVKAQLLIAAHMPFLWIPLYFLLTLHIYQRTDMRIRELRERIYRYI